LHVATPTGKALEKLRRCAEPNSTRKSSSLKRGNFAGNFT